MQFVFTDPDETVTIDVRPVADGRTRIGYHQPAGSADAVHGAESMLDALASSIAASAPGREPAPRSPGRPDG